MLPQGEPTQNTFDTLLNLLGEGDIIIDGGNSNFHDTLKRHKLAKEKKISFLDVGVSGGIIAAQRGYPMMIGGDASHIVMNGGQNGNGFLGNIHTFKNGGRFTNTGQSLGQQIGRQMIQMQINLGRARNRLCQ